MSLTINLSPFFPLPDTIDAPAPEKRHEKRPDAARDLRDVSTRLIEATPTGAPVGREARIALAITGTLLRLMEAPGLPPALGQQLPALLRDLHAAIACANPTMAAAIRLQAVVEAVAAALPEADEAARHAAAQAEEGLNAMLSAAIVGSGYDAPAQPNAALPRVANLMLLTTLQFGRPHADPAVASAYRAIAGNLLTLAALMGQTRVPAPVQDALHGLIDRANNIVRGRIRQLSARAALGEGMALLLRAINESGGDPLGSKHALLSLWGDLNALALLAGQNGGRNGGPVA